MAPIRKPFKKPERGGARSGPARGPSPFRARAPRGDASAFERTSRPSRDDAPEERYRTIGGGVKIVHEDADLIVLDKPTGMLSASVDSPDQESVFQLLKEYAREKSRRRGVKAWIIHRLDKEASGLLVFAKSEKAFHWLKEDFKAKRVHRIYTAVLEGEVSGAPAGTIQGYLLEGDDGIVRVVSSPTAAKKTRKDDDEEARLAVTHYRVLRVGHGRTLVQVRLETGRKNQIRAHMQSIGRPIAGDRRYGAAGDPVGRVCLHASELGFTHPGTGEQLRFRSPAPHTFEVLVGGAPSLRDGSEAAPESPAPERASVSAARGAMSSGTASTGTASSWDHVAAWYDELLEGRRSDHYDQVILPGTVRLLSPRAGERVLDVACGQGILCRELQGLGAACVGVDSSAQLIGIAQRLDPKSTYLAGDARELAGLEAGPEFDAATCVMALMNIEPLSPVMAGVAKHLKAGGRFVSVVLHPAFRSPGQTSWGWAEVSNDDPAPRKPGSRSRAPSAPTQRQFRRVDGYLSPAQREIVMNPGAASHGRGAVTTVTHHRPIQAYVKALCDVGLRVTALEEWASARQSQPGPRAGEENRARREIPMFLAIRAEK
jgi:RluA family pseudouridine synthase